MLLPVVFCQLQTPFAKLLLHERIYYNFFTHRVPGDLPTELVRPAVLSLRVATLVSAFVLVMILVHLHVSSDYASHIYHRK